MSRQLVLSALGRAAADPAGLPLHGGRSAAGLFPATAGGRQAARRCLDDGLLRPVEPEAAKPHCVLTDKGMTYLLAEADPRPVLEDFVRALEQRQSQLDGLLAAARESSAALVALKANADRVLQHLGRSDKPAGLSALFGAFHNGPAAPPADDVDPAILSHLAGWQESGASEDCPLPDLYRRCAADVPGLTVGHFHDALRQLRQAERVNLHPWTGPLYALPEPLYALLDGHVIAYYARLRG